MIQLALRYLIKFKQFSLINIVGLSLGASAGFILLGFVFFESGFDNYHPEGNKIYRVLMHQVSSSGGSEYYASTFSPVPKRMADDFPEVTDFVRTFTDPSLISYHGNEGIQAFNEEKVAFASESFFSMFSVPIILGDNSGNLTQPNAAYISESASRKYFGNESPINKTITRNGTETYTVYGVFSDPAFNTHFDFDFILSYQAYAASPISEDVDNNWSWWDTYYSYIKLADNTTPEQLEAKLADFIMKYRGDTWKERGYRMDLLLQPISAIHYGLAEGTEIVDDVRTTRKSNLVTFSLIAIFILVVAWINFINLATAQSFMRAKEVGVRKMLGSGKRQLLKQFMLESLLTNGIAILIAIAFTWSILPYIMVWLDLHIQITDFLNPTFLAGYFMILLLGALFSGYYPSLILLSHEPIKILKGNFNTSIKGNLYRNILLVFQFTCTLFLIVSTLGVYKQVVYMSNQNIGVNIDKKVTFTAPIQRDSTYDQRIKTFLTELTSYPMISGYSTTSTVPGMAQEFQIGGVRRLNGPVDNASHFGLSYIDEHFVDFFGLTLLVGSNLSEATQADRDHVLINETAARILGYNNYEQAIGDQIVIPRGTVTVKGVLKDYHNQSLKSAFEPSVYRLREEGFKTHHTISLAAAADRASAIALTERKWRETFEGSPFTYFELKDHYQQQYRTETNFGSLILIFACMAILIACLGLYSLASFNLLRNQKEIAVRKVLGAPTAMLMLSQYRKYIQLIVWAAVLAIPVGLYFIQQWLQVFANRITLGADLVILPVVLIVIITCIAITHIILKAVNVNPVEVIRKD